jgi:5'-3' exonuclease
MMKNKIIDAILTEDTDLIAHGNNNILYKMDNEGT